MQAGLSEYDVIRLVNYIRSEVAAGRDPRPALAQCAAEASTPTALDAPPAVPWADDDFLRPQLEDDTLLFFQYADEPTYDWGPMGYAMHLVPGCWSSTVLC